VAEGAIALLIATSSPLTRLRDLNQELVGSWLEERSDRRARRPSSAAGVAFVVLPPGRRERHVV